MVEIITIDGAGRLVVPKALRRKLRLVKGSRLRVTGEGGRLVFEPVPEECTAVEVNGLLVIRGRLAGEVPDHRTLRDRRIEHLVSSGR
jgi:AbrB family looped-hinge helix DNA binding protein